MSIRLRLIVSFLAILLLTTANIVAYFWSSATRAEVVTRLDRARTRQVIVSTLRENIGNLHKQISLSNEVKPMQEADIREFGQILAQKLSSIRGDIDTLAGLTDPEQRSSTEHFRSQYEELAGEWTHYEEELGKDESSALTHLARAELEAQQILNKALPALQQAANQEAQGAATEFQDVGRFTSRMVLLFFLLSALISLVVAYSVSRYLAQGLRELREGAALIGGMQLDYQIPVKRRDEIADLALAFNDMAKKLLAARLQLIQTNEELRASEQRHRSLVDHAVYGMYRCTLEGRFLDVNPALSAMLGFAPTELLAMNPARDIYVNPSDCDHVVQSIQVKGRIEGVEVQWRRKDGIQLVVRLSGSAALDEQGNAKEFEMIAEDFTERRRLEEQLRQAQKMEAVGRLAGGVAHDFNNLLTVIKGHSDLILNDLRQDHPLHSDVEEIERAADRAAAVTSQLLAFSRRQVLAPRVLDMNTLVDGMQKLLRRLLGEDVELVTLLDAGLNRVKADPGQVEQVIMNLAVNARDAMPRGGVLTLRTSNIHIDGDRASEQVALKPGAYVVLSVVDNGIGMDAATQAQIFEPFFTTKEPGKGTGLGLATAYGIVRQSGGEIAVQSQPGTGSTFRVYLPAVRAEPEAAKFEPRSTEAGGSETVLVVEDEAGVRNLIRQILEQKGYQVLLAGCKDEALELCRVHPGPIHLLLSDVVLKDINGQELSGFLVRLRPQMRVLLMSGYTQDAILQRGVLNQDTDFLPKPFTPAGLASKVREVLDK
jgi:PAS domain S-box-containing protein